MKPIMYTHTQPIDHYERTHSIMGDYEYMPDEKRRTLLDEETAIAWLLLVIVKGSAIGLVISILFMSI